VNIVISDEEYAFLCALNRRNASRESGAGSLPDALRRAERVPSGAGRIVVVPLTPAEARDLDRLARDSYAFITLGERRARLVLREKIRRAFGPPSEPDEEPAWDGW